MATPRLRMTSIAYKIAIMTSENLLTERFGDGTSLLIRVRALFFIAETASAMFSAA
jgi:hypothetical protein